MPVEPLITIETAGSPCSSGSYCSTTEPSITTVVGQWFASRRTLRLRGVGAGMAALDTLLFRCGIPNLLPFSTTVELDHSDSDPHRIRQALHLAETWVPLSILDPKDGVVGNPRSLGDRAKPPLAPLKFCDDYIEKTWRLALHAAKHRGICLYSQGICTYPLAARSRS